MESMEEKDASSSGENGSMTAAMLRAFSKLERPKPPIWATTCAPELLAHVSSYQVVAPRDTCQLEVEIQDAVEEWPEAHRAIIGGLMHGMTRAEVAEYLGVSKRTVHRVVARLRRRLS